MISAEYDIGSKLKEEDRSCIVNLSPALARPPSNVCPVGKYPTCSVQEFQDAGLVWSYAYSHARHEYTPSIRRPIRFDYNAPEISARNMRSGNWYRRLRMVTRDL